MTQLTLRQAFGPPNGLRVAQEVEELITYFEELEFDPHTFVIIVCCHGTSEIMVNELKNTKQKKSLERLKNFGIGVTDDIRVNSMIRKAEDLGIYDNLVIITSSFINELHFNVGFRIMDLKIYRLDIDHDTQGFLLLNGLSTFRGLIIQCWESMTHNSKLWLGPGVVISVDPGIGQWRELCGGYSAKSEFDHHRLLSHVEEMNSIKIQGNWWNQFRAPIAGILGILTGATRFASTACVKMSSGGAFFHYKFAGDALNIAGGVAGLKAGAALGSTAGNALLVASGAAAAIYFISWESFFAWLKTILSWLNIGIKNICDKIRDWLAACASTIRDSLTLHHSLAFPA